MDVEQASGESAMSQEQRRIIEELGPEIGLEGPIETVIERLQNAAQEGWQRIRCGIYEGNVLVKTREETDAEMGLRLDQERRIKEARRRQYELLKREFG